MRFITEEDLRQRFRRERFTEYEPEAGTRLTPGARQFLSDRGIRLTETENGVRPGNGQTGFGKKEAGSSLKQNEQRKQRSVYRELIRQKNCPAGSLSLETFRLIFFRQDWIFKERMFLFQRKSLNWNGILPGLRPGKRWPKEKGAGKCSVRPVRESVLKTAESVWQTALKSQDFMPSHPMAGL
jgi:hypothetical protein